MKKSLLILMLAVVLLGAFNFPFLYQAVHDLIGLHNTVYSTRFTPERFARVKEGMTREQVVSLLGVPMSSSWLDRSYPPWAEGIESLVFSRAKGDGDFGLVYVWIGADQKVRSYGRAVTD